MSLRHGFKASANRMALRLRGSFGLRPHDPIDLRAIANRLKIPVIELSSFREAHVGAVDQLFVVDQAAFSAATVPLPTGRRVIVYNDSHDRGRQNNSIAHEISHILLGHPPALPIDPSGKRLIDREIEEEANWLGPTILISNEAALHIVRVRMGTEVACDLYGVSPQLLQMRRNASGAVIRAQRSTRFTG
jgi:hypothetical protein